MLPCTPAGIMHILDTYNINLKGNISKKIITKGLKTTVVGRGNLVGYPLAYMLLKRNA
jgi:methylenetetrahydrofolate dehydrogenase (NADP+)/methenyltetrahydrofolate cyclohydrolase